MAFLSANLWFTGSIAMRYCWYTYAALLVQGCCTFSARVLHFYWHYYSKVFTVAFLLAKSFDFRLILIVPWNSNLEFRVKSVELFSLRCDL